MDEKDDPYRVTFKDADPLPDSVCVRICVKLSADGRWYGQGSYYDKTDADRIERLGRDDNGEFFFVDAVLPMQKPAVVRGAVSRP